MAPILVHTVLLIEVIVTTPTTTQHNLNTVVGLDMKITVQTPLPHQLNVGNISAVTDPFLMKL